MDEEKMMTKINVANAGGKGNPKILVSVKSTFCIKCDWKKNWN